MKTLTVRRVIQSVRYRLSRFLGRGFAHSGQVDYTAQHIRIATRYVKPHGKDVLVIGCNTGRECRLFIELGARAVHGVDVIAEVGQGYSDPRITYHRISAERMDLNDNQFDLTYCFATMEHISRIDFAFPELVRVTKPGGIIYSVSAPLWNSRYGHHKDDIFPNFPWIHLRLTKDEILAYCRQRGIGDPMSGVPIEVHVEYMLNPTYFNKTPAKKYLEVCNQLRGVKIIRNDITYDDDSLLPQAIFAELAERGYAREELLASVHTFVARKLSEAR